MKIKIFLLSVLIITGAAFAAPARAETPVLRTATEAVMYTGGYLDATAEVQRAAAAVPTDLTPPPHSQLSFYSFRLMAAVNRSTATLMGSMGYLVGQAYFLGRASAFDALADFVGEP